MYIKLFIQNGRLTVNNAIISKNYKVKENDCILIDYPDPVPLSVCAENIPLDIIYEDEFLLVVIIAVILSLKLMASYVRGLFIGLIRIPAVFLLLLRQTTLIWAWPNRLSSIRFFGFIMDLFTDI